MTGEQLAKQYRAEHAGRVEGTRESLLRCATMLYTYAPDLFPANESGQIHFARAMMDSVADEIRKFLNTLPQESPMSVRSKVRCTSKLDNAVTFTTVYEPDETKNDENARFTKATPWGDISLGIDNPEALAQFEVNREYYVDFTPAS